MIEDFESPWFGIVSNDYVYGVEDSIRASKYPMATSVEQTNYEVTPTVEKLMRAEIGSGHDNFLNGVVVQFDLTFTLKAWTEAQRYHFLDFVSSQSTMHRITKFNIAKQCNEYVDGGVKHIVERLVKEYNDDPTDEKYLKVLYNVPTGFKLTARMTTNYRQLKTIYRQRKNHRLPEWRAFCKWIETLPYMDTVLGLTEEKTNE